MGTRRAPGQLKHLMAQTVLVMAGYQPIAEWMCKCLEVDGHMPVVAKDVEETLRIAFLLDIDLIVAWPSISSCNTDEFLAAVRGDPRVKGIPVLLVAFQPSSCGVDLGAEWIRAPFTANEFLLKVRRILDDTRSARRACRRSPPPSGGRSPRRHLVRSGRAPAARLNAGEAAITLTRVLDAQAGGPERGDLKVAPTCRRAGDQALLDTRHGFQGNRAIRPRKYLPKSSVSAGSILLG